MVENENMSVDTELKDKMDSVIKNLGFENKNNNQLNKEAVLDMLRKNEITFKEADELLKQIGG